jgi:DNA-binding CsgD family transcriptional regulator
VAATLLYDDANWRGALHGGVSARLLEEALPLATDESTAVRLRASLGRAFALSGQSERGLAISEAALADAEGSGDYKAKQVAYSAVSFAMWTPQRLGRMLTLARRYVDEARGVGDLDSELGALGKLLYGKITAGELGDARAVRARYRAVARQLCQPLFLRLDYQAEVLFAVGEGRFVDAEVAALEADGLSRFLSANQAPGSIGVQMFSLRREQGRLEEARPVVEAIARSGQADRTWKPALALLYAELGEHDLAAEQLHELVRDRLAAIPRDSLWCGALGYLADACLMVGDQEAAPIIYRELLPWQGLVVQVGHLLAAHGAVDRFLGSLAELTGNDGDAKSYFEAALRLEDKCRMPVWSARTYLAYGRFLSRRRQKGDVEQARALLQTALDTANSHAMVKLTSEASDALASLSKVSSRGAAEIVRGLTQRELTILRQLATGRSNREIGERLHISQHTAANHVRAILLKTGCANRTEATAWAIRCGLAPE